MTRQSSIGLEASIWAPRNNSRQSAPLHKRPRTKRRYSATTYSSSKTTTTAATNTSTSTSTSTTCTTLSPTQALRRFEQACQRLRWKSIDLEAAYRRALAPSPSPWAFSRQDAERNFKIDFYEFYAWIEKAIVLLLVVFSVPIPSLSSSSSSSAAAAAWSRIHTSKKRSNPTSHHAYHHEVLRALEQDTANPLHKVLGRGDVNQALWKAKELRNRWKDVAAATTVTTTTTTDRNKKGGGDGYVDNDREEEEKTPPLKMYDLAWIVGEVLRGLEDGYALAKATFPVEAMAVASSATTAAAAGAGAGAGDGEVGNDEGDQGWDWMVEMMDWEA